jgi:hypothetical protein
MKLLRLVATLPALLMAFTPIAPEDMPGRVDSAVTQGLAVEIVPSAAKNAFDNMFVVRFKNLGSRPLRLLRGLDGSEEGWLMPHYRLTLWDDEGRPLLKMRGRCGLFGLWADTKWPDDYLIELRPRQAREVRTYVPQAVPRNGTYRAVFEYVYAPTARTRSAGLEYPAGLWEGAVRSPEVELHLEAW